MGAGLGESARAALMTRGYAEMVRFAVARGARAETLAGLSGFGDLALTCTCEKSRNYAYGLQLGLAGQATTTATTEGIATARAVAALAGRQKLEMPITATMAQVLEGEIAVGDAVAALMARPLRPE
jgi:glycerol-3-phosphate dehydrogenase (NAD(P)+)